MVRLAAVLLALVLAPPVFARPPLTERQASLEVILDPLEAQPVAGQMLLATVRGEYRVRIALEDLTLPRSGSFDWMQLARDQWTEEQVDGLPTQVMRRRIAIFPRRAGSLQFPGLEHRLTIFTEDGGRADHAVASDPVPISVRPAPGAPWLPVTAIEFSEDWDRDPATLPMGESARRRVVIRALGATAEMMPVRPEIRAPWLISFPSPEQRTTELTPLGPLSTLVWEWSLRPKTGERGVIPEIRIPYFDVETQRPGALLLAAATVSYAAAPDAAEPAPWRSDFTGTGYLVAGFGLGLLTPLLMLGAGARLRSGAEIVRILARLGPHPARRRLQRAAGRGDAAAMRRAAADLLANLPPERTVAARQVLSPLDRQLFGPPPSVPVALPPLARRFLRLLRSA